MSNRDDGKPLHHQRVDIVILSLAIINDWMRDKEHDREKLGTFSNVIIIGKGLERYLNFNIFSIKTRNMLGLCNRGILCWDLNLVSMQTDYKIDQKCFWGSVGMNAMVFIYSAQTLRLSASPNTHTHIEDPLQLQLYWAHISIQYSHPSETNKQKMNI